MWQRERAKSSSTRFSDRSHWKHSSPNIHSHSFAAMWVRSLAQGHNHRCRYGAGFDLPTLPLLDYWLQLPRSQDAYVRKLKISSQDKWLWQRERERVKGRVVRSLIPTGKTFRLDLSFSVGIRSFDETFNQKQNQFSPDAIFSSAALFLFYYYSHREKILSLFLCFCFLLSFLLVQKKKKSSDKSPTTAAMRHTILFR